MIMEQLDTNNTVLKTRSAIGPRNANEPLRKSMIRSTVASNRSGKMGETTKAHAGNAHLSGKKNSLEASPTKRASKVNESSKTTQSNNEADVNGEAAMEALLGAYRTQSLQQASNVDAGDSPFS